MTDLREAIRRAADRHEPPEEWLDRIQRRARTRRHRRTIAAGAAGLGVAFVLTAGLVSGLQARDPSRSAGPGAVPSPVCGSVSVEPTGWWRAEGSPTDAVGAHHAILHGGVTFAPGVTGRAFALNGVDAYLEIPDGRAPQLGSDDFTVALWVRFSSTTGEQVLAEDWVERATASRGWTLTKLRSDAIGFAVSGAGSAETPPLDLPRDTWIHVAARREGGTLSLFVNGDLAAVGTLRDPAVSADSRASLKFGHRGISEDTPRSLDRRDFFVRGSLDEIVLFVGRALSEAEIEQIFEGQPSCDT